MQTTKSGATADPTEQTPSDGSSPPAALRPATVVTGASEGIGRAIAARFARAGHDVLLVARRAIALENAAQRIRATSRANGRVLVLALDVTTADAARIIDDHLAQNGLYAAILVNNAGLGLGGSFIGQDAGEIERLLTLNITALTRLTHSFARQMADRGAGSIINVGSLAGYVPGPNQATYYASKAYVQSLSEALASELAANGVHVAVVSPGPTRTAIHATMHAQRALYRILLPDMTPERVALSVYWGYRMKRRVIVPGLHVWAASWAMRLLPHWLTVPLIGQLLKPR